MPEPSPNHPWMPYRRSVTLYLAYAALLASIINLLAGTGFIWIASMAALAILLGALEAIRQLWHRRSARPSSEPGGPPPEQA